MLNWLRGHYDAVKFLLGGDKVKEPPAKIHCQSECGCKDETTSSIYTVVEVNEEWSEEVHEKFGKCDCGDNYVVATIRIAQASVKNQIFAGVITDYSCLSCSWSVAVE